jgi:hypothetical protein
MTITRNPASVVVLLSMLTACGSDNSGDAVVKYKGQFPPLPQAVGGIPVIAPETFGAVGNGVTDDHIAIQAAITAACTAGGGIIFFSAKTYEIAEHGIAGYGVTITCSNITLLGIRGQSWLRLASGAAAGTEVVNVAGDVDNFTIRDLGLDGNWGNAATIYVPPQQPFTVYNEGSGWVSAPGSTYATGDGPVYIFGTVVGGPPSPLLVQTGYWIIDEPGGYVAFATSYANAIAGTAIVLTSAGTGTNSIEGMISQALPQSTINVASTAGVGVGNSAFPSGSNSIQVVTSTGTQAVDCTGVTLTSFTGCAGGSGMMVFGSAIGRVGGNPKPAQTFVVLNSTTGTLTVTGTQGMLTGSHVTLTTTGTLPAGFATGTTYYVIPVSTSTSTYVIELASSLANAQAGTAITSITGGTGTYTLNVTSPGSLNQTWQTSPVSSLLFMAGAQNVLIDGAKFRNAYGDAIEFGGNSTSTTDISRIANNVIIRSSTFDMLARDGLTINDARGVMIDHCSFTNARQGAIYAQPVSYGIKTVTIESNNIDGWWDYSQSLANLGISADGIGGNGGWAARGASIFNWRIHDNFVNVPSVFSGVYDFQFMHNHMVMDTSASSSAGIQVQLGGGDNEISDNWFYMRGGSVGSIESGDAASAVIAVLTAQFGGNLYSQSNVAVNDNVIFAKNGRVGILAFSPGGSIQNATGSASAVNTATVVDSTQSWTTNQWVGATVRIGNAYGVVNSNTATVLTLVPVVGDVSTGWSTFYGDFAATPAGTTYYLHRETGVTDIERNTINLADDGNGPGSAGIYLTATTTHLPGMRVRVIGNKIDGANTHAIFVDMYSSVEYALLDIENNFDWDDQQTPTTTDLISISGALNVAKLVMGGNVTGENGSAALNGVSSGTWLTRDGEPQEWTGYGSPASVVVAPVGSTYVRLDGSSSTTLYVKETGSGTSTGWVAK